MKTKEVTVQMGVTRNLGDFQSARLDVSLTLESEGETPDELYAEAKVWVSNKITQFIEGSN